MAGCGGVTDHLEDNLPKENRLLPPLSAVDGSVEAEVPAVQMEYALWTLDFEACVDEV
jgi:hypothetical protein